MLLKNKNSMIKLVAALVLGALMFAFVALTHNTVDISSEDSLIVATLFSLLFIATSSIFAVNEKTDLMNFLFISLSVAALLYIRIALLYFPSRDYNIYLSQWLLAMRPLSVKEALVTEIGDYNLPYLYFLIILSRFKLNDLIFIKFFSCVFDVLTAYFVMKVVALKTDKKHWQLLSFAFTLAVPTVILNSSFWGQCDSVYAAFCVASLYYAMKERGFLSIAMFSLAFVFKLQSIFIVPALLVCLIIKKIKPIHLSLFPIIFVAASLPAIIAGRNLASIVGIYANQASEYSDLVLNAPSVFQLVGNVSFDNFKVFGIFFAGVAVFMLVYICYVYRESINQKDMVSLFFLSSLIFPYLLPSMHDRYFFLADVLSVLLFFYDRKKWYVPLITVFASYVSYSYYAMSYKLVDQKLTAIALLVIILIVTKDFVAKISNKKI